MHAITISSQSNQLFDTVFKLQGRVLFRKLYHVLKERGLLPNYVAYYSLSFVSFGYLHYISLPIHSKVLVYSECLGWLGVHLRALCVKEDMQKPIHRDYYNAGLIGSIVTNTNCLELLQHQQSAVKRLEGESK